MKAVLSALACALGLWGTAAAAQPSVAAQPSATNAILILDASGSMWGQVQGQTKIVAARAAVDKILSTWRPGDRLGLMAYGHRSKGDCKDIELVVPIGPVQAAAFREAVAGLNPRGKTPIAASLREAASVLKSTEERATVILVSDGLETCEPDPCAAAAELKKAGLGFTAHVVGFDITDPVARAQLQCIAAKTGGVYLDARDASGLDAAMTKAADAVRGTKVASDAPAQPPAADPFAGKNLRATARLAEGSDPLTDSKLVWSLHLPDADGRAGEHVQSEYGARLATTAKPGRYVLKVDYGSVSREFPVTVEARKPASYDVVLDAGFVSATGRVPGGSLGNSDIAWQVIDAGGDSVTSEYTPGATFVLPAGSYRLKLTKGQASAEQALTLAAGDSLNVAIDLPVGRLLVDAVYSKAGPKVGQGLVVEVRKPSSQMGEPGENIASGYEPQSIFDLLEGSYELTVGAGDARREVKAEVKSGQAGRLTVDLDAGVVALTGPEGAVIEVYEAQTSIEGTRKLLNTGYDGKLGTVLPAGDYVAVLTREGTKVGETPFSVVAGRRLELALK